VQQLSSWIRLKKKQENYNVAGLIFSPKITKILDNLQFEKSHKGSWKRENWVMVPSYGDGGLFTV
jgi:hypothetical protein